ncbi:MAG: helix-turn-helix transcriptional regulator [Acidobacteriaceae bacterium]
MGERFLRLKEVRARIPLSRSSLYSRIKSGDFPKPINLGARAVAWLESDIDEWINGRIVDDKGSGGTA